jgi:hypothetical protein
VWSKGEGRKEICACGAWCVRDASGRIEVFEAPEAEWSPPIRPSRPTKVYPVAGKPNGVHR